METNKISTAIVFAKTCAKMSNNPEAGIMDEATAQLGALKARLTQAEGMAGHCLQALTGWSQLYPDDWDIVDKIAMEEISKFLGSVQEGKVNE